MQKVFKVGDRVLANCGTRKEPNWIAGTVLEVEDLNSALISRPYRIRLDIKTNDRDHYYFSKSYVKTYRAAHP